MVIKCPFCNITQKDHWQSGNWKYNGIDVQRFECQCGQKFNHYRSSKSTWTIPKLVTSEKTV